MVAEREFTRRMLQRVLTVSATVIVLAVVWTARSALMVIYVSGLIAVGFSPLVRFIERPARSGKHVLPHTVAILAVYLHTVGALVLVGLIVVPPLVEQAGRLRTQ